MFLDIDKKVNTDIAAVDDSGGSITYGQLCDFSARFNSYIKTRSLIFILSENCIGALSGFVASLSGRVIPLLLSCNTWKGH